MRTIDVFQEQSNRNQSLRLVMLLIIVGTFPFYCFAVYLIGSSPVEIGAARVTQSARPAASFTPLGANLFPSSSPSAARTTGPPRFATMTPLSFPLATPVQYVPPTPIPADTIVAQTLVSPSPLPTASITPRPTATPGVGDADFDGVLDDADSCPNAFGFADNGGCPYPDDPDRDGIRGAADLCPNEFAADNPRGCRDFDDDGLDTSEDDCPQEVGPAANRGCPLEAVAGG